MELLIIGVLVIGALVIFNIIAFWFFDQRIVLEHKKTRKETQEIKTRLTQVRKDLNKLEKKHGR